MFRGLGEVMTVNGRKEVCGHAGPLCIYS